MATLTTLQIDSFRRKIGDHEPNDAGGYDLDDSTIQSVYDDHDSDEMETIVSLLEMRWAMWINVTDAISETGGSTIKSQKQRQIKALLDYYSKKAGNGYFTLRSSFGSVGLLDYGLDQEDET